MVMRVPSRFILRRRGTVIGRLFGPVSSCAHGIDSLWSRPGRFPVHALTPDKHSTDLRAVIGAESSVKSVD